MGLVQNQDRIIGNGVQNVLTNIRLALLGLQLFVCREYGVVAFRQFFTGQNVLDDGIVFPAGRRGQFRSIRRDKRIFAGHVPVRDEWREICCADIVQVSYHIGVQIRQHGHKYRCLAVLFRPSDDTGTDTALADTGLIAKDESLAVPDVVQGKRQGIDLFGRECSVHVSDGIVSEFFCDEGIQIAVFFRHVFQRTAHRGFHVGRNECPELVTVGMCLVGPLCFGSLGRRFFRFVYIQSSLCGVISSIISSAVCSSGFSPSSSGCGFSGYPGLSSRKLIHP